MELAHTVFFNFYGLQIMVKSENTAIIKDIHRDFSFFHSAPVEPSAVVEVIEDSGPRNSLPQLRASLQTPRNIVYRDHEHSYVDYFGRALMIYSDKEQKHTVFCDDRDLAHEITYLTLLAKVGAHLDAIALHRVHALGVEAAGKAFLILLPMAGGKTSLALNLLRSKEIRLLSEDSPLVSPSGKIFPFPLRIGIRVGHEPPGIPSKYCRTVKRMEFGPKTLIDIEYFNDRIAGACSPGAILIGERWLAGSSSIHRIPRREALKAFIKNSVVGLGLYQGMEFLLERSGWEVLGKTGLALSRLRNSLSVIRQSEVFRFILGPDVEKSSMVLTRFLHEFVS
jgi:hypothetical protein